METRDILAKVGDLPTLPAVAARINAEIENEALTAHLLGVIISEDVSLTARVLRLANSAFYGMPRQIASIERAVMVLGFETVKNLAMSISIFSFFKKGIGPRIDVIGLWNHSLGVAVSARILLSRIHPKLAEEAFLLGILHDIGKIILLNQCKDDMEQVCIHIGQDGLSEEEAEMKVFGFTHQKIGALTIKEWKFPEVFVTGVQLHHFLPPMMKDGDEATAGLIRAVCVANQLAKALGLGNSTNQSREPIPSVLWKQLGFGRHDLPGLGVAVREDYQRILQSWSME